MNQRAEELQEVYKWVDTIPLSRTKKNIARDFSDGVLISEIVHHFFPKLIELHNYSATNSVAQKAYNWRTVNQKVFRKMGFHISDQDVNDIVTCKRGTVERVLYTCKIYFAKYQKKIQEKRKNRSLSTRNKKMSKNTNILSPTDMNISPNMININEDTKSIIAEKDRIIQHLNEKMEILELKVLKMEQLLRLKDGKIEALANRLS